MLQSDAKLHQFERYASNVFALPDLLASLSDTRRAPEIPTFDVVNSLFHTALLRIPSINALEGDLKESDFQKLIGRKPTPTVKAFSADVVANVLDKLRLGGACGAIETVIHRAERNKAFREGYGARRCVAMDGWEPFSSYDRHCPHCLDPTNPATLYAGRQGFAVIKSTNGGTNWSFCQLGDHGP